VSKQQQGFPVSTGGKQKREKRRAKMTLGLINANPVVHAKKEGSLAPKIFTETTPLIL
jgi:hypothetical protein